MTEPDDEPLRVLPLGLDGLLVEVRDVPAALALHARLAALHLPGVVELVPAARTLAVRFEPGVTTAAAVRAALRERSTDVVPTRPGALVEVPVVYDGADLAEVAARAGLTVDAVVLRHSAPEYTVAFTGFAPGFAYLTGGDPVLDLPRRTSPRTAIPAGAVAIAGGHSGIYPRVSPGGWHLLGHTDLVMWDPARTGREALLRPGMRVRFRPVPAAAAGPRDGGAGDQGAGVADPHAGARVVPGPPRSASRPATASPVEGSRDPGRPARPAVEVVSPGAFTTVQDLGRPGHAALGVPRSGALDRAALRRANRLLGNAAGAAGLEHVGGGLRIRALRALVVAVTGGAGPIRIHRATSTSDAGPADAAPPDPDAIDVVPASADRPLALHPGDLLELGAPTSGVVATIAVLGGVDVPPVLGSRSTDVLSGLGPAPLRAGDRLRVGRETVAAVSDVPEAGPGFPAAGDVVEVRFVPGPRDDWFVGGADALAATRWRVTPRSNRVGVRLEGPDDALVRTRADELASEATVPGAVQVPPEGRPVVFLADHPVTGGYPVIGVVVPEDLGLVAQVPVGSTLRFRPTAPGR